MKWRSNRIQNQYAAAKEEGWNVVDREGSDRRPVVLGVVPGFIGSKIDAPHSDSLHSAHDWSSRNDTQSVSTNFT